MTPLLMAHYDLKRTMWTPAYFNRWNRLMSGWGYNHVLLEIEDKYRFRNHPSIAHADALAPDALRKQVAVMRAAGLEPVPMIQSLAHAEYVLKHPEYAHLREDPHHDEQYEPTAPAVYELLFDLCDDLIETCQPSAFFHLGGDESWRLGTSPRYKPVVDEFGAGELYVRHMLPILEHVHERGLRPIIWADIVLSHPEVIARLPRYVILMDWDYWTTGERVPTFLNQWGARKMLKWPDYAAEIRNPAFERQIAPYLIDDETRQTGLFRGFATADALHAMGFDLITASAARCMGDSVGVPHNSMHLPNAFHSARKGTAVGLGHCVTSWAVRHVHPDTTLAAFYTAARALGRDAPESCPTGFPALPVGRRVPSPPRSGSPLRRAGDCAPYQVQGSGQGNTPVPFDPDGVVRDFATDFFGADLPGLAEAMRLAEPYVPFCQSFELAREDAALQAGRNPFDEYLKRGPQVEGGNARRLADVVQALASYRQARELFRDLHPRVRRNPEALECWIEGLELVMTLAAIDQSLLEGRLKEDAAPHRAALARCRAAGRPLLSAAYTELGTEAELHLRYDVIGRMMERYLSGA